MQKIKHEMHYKLVVYCKNIGHVGYTKYKDLRKIQKYFKVHIQIKCIKTCILKSEIKNNA